MNAKPIPEFMKEYMERIGDDCFLDFQRLSREYHNTKQAFNEFVLPKWIPANGRMPPKIDLEAEKRRIDATFKERALEIGCKYGYELPAQEYYDMDLSAMQEDGIYQDRISHDGFDLLPEDRRAIRAHKAFEKKYPELMKDRQSNREIIEYYFGDGRSTPKPERVKEEPEKEELKREDRVTRYSINRDDILSIEDPGNGSAPSRDVDMPPPDGTNPSKDRDDMEMER